MTPLEWFEILYGDADRGWLTICSKADAAKRKTPKDPFTVDSWHHVSSIKAAAARVKVLTDKQKNCYYGLGLRKERLQENFRGSGADVCALFGLWADLDVTGGTHRKTSKNYFPTKNAAVEFLNEMLPLKPTAIIDSGGGVHAYWLFHELWWLEDDDKEHAEAILNGWLLL